MPIKQIVKSILPGSVLKAVRYYRAQRGAEQEHDLTQVFSRIYQDNIWGASGDQAQRFYSGSGSHQEHILAAYKSAVGDFLGSLEARPNVVDLGCGDFNVGSSLRNFCANYVACDIVPSLIEFNRKKYRSLNVDFRVLDLTRDELPKADVVFIRQVLQHLSNYHITAAIAKIASSYRFVVLTEHLPESAQFTPNLDKRAGAGVRAAYDSGLVLTQPPFNLQVTAERILCEVPEDGPYGGRLRTTLYELA